MNNIVVILSGGMDSTTLLYDLLSEWNITAAVSFDYGQRHIKELECAKQTIEFLKKKGYDIEHKIIKVPFGQLTGSALTTNKTVPEGHYASENMKATVVANRNMIFVSIAASLALTNNSLLALGVHAGDHTIYRDCRWEFIQAVEQVVKIGNWDSENFGIHVPYIHITKGEIAIRGKIAAAKLGINPSEIYKRTSTCYNGLETACGKCGSCVERLEAFEFAGIKDPLNYT